MATYNAMISTLDRPYAEAIIALADEAGELDTIVQQLRELRDLAKAEPDFLRLLSTRTIAAAEQAALLRRLLEGKVHDLLLRFLLVVNTKRRLERLPEIVTAVEALLDERNGVLQVEAHVASPLSDEQARGVANRIGSALGKTVELQQTVDPALIGGLKIRVGDSVIDGSVATQLQILRQNMIEAGLTQAREQDLFVAADA